MLLLPVFFPRLVYFEQAYLVCCSITELFETGCPYVISEGKIFVFEHLLINVLDCIMVLFMRASIEYYMSVE